MKGLGSSLVVVLVGNISLGLLGSQAFAHPLGGGLLDVGAGLLILGQSQAGLLKGGGVDFQLERAQTSGVGANLGLRVPVMAAFGLEASGAFSNSASEFTETAVAPASGVYKSSLGATGHTLRLAVVCWPSEFFRAPFMVGTDGNPDGPLLWPVLQVSALWLGQGTAQSLVKHTGGFLNASAGPPSSSDALVGNYTLALPVSQFFSVFAAYGREYSTQFKQGPVALSDGGQSESLSAGASFFLAWDPERPVGSADTYMPRVGWPGQCRVDLSYGRQYHRPTGRVLAQTLGMVLSVPVDKGVSVGLAYTLLMLDRGLLDGPPNFSSARSNNNQHQLSVEATVPLSRLFGRG
jgi:hypothetical protein